MFQHLAKTSAQEAAADPEEGREQLLNAGAQKAEDEPHEDKASGHLECNAAHHAPSLVEHARVASRAYRLACVSLAELAHEDARPSGQPPRHIVRILILANVPSPRRRSLEIDDLGVGCRRLPVLGRAFC